MFLGIRTVIYPTTDLAATKAWFTDLLGYGPYFDEPFFVGFQVGGYELGVLPLEAGAEHPGVLTYWGVRDADAAFTALVERGCTVHTPVTEVGDGIKTATLHEPAGSLLGIIENPVFALADPPASATAIEGPGL
jgi:catechol 2,3-dioxygenase-like lactoylglutathione lyase family enzyme